MEERLFMQYSYDEIIKYIKEIKDAVSAGRYRIEINKKRQKNTELFRDYLISEEKCREILLSLEVNDFCEILHNEHEGFEHELLYVFGKEVRLLQRFGEEEELLSLYIKFNKLFNRYVIVISFHKQEYPLVYAFK